MDESFSTALKEARKARGWTQEDLARQLGVSQQSVQKWEAGTSLPRTARREPLIRALGLHQKTQQQLDKVMSAAEGRNAVIVNDQFIHERRFLPGAVREQALLAAIDQALPSEYQCCLEPPRPTGPPGVRFAADYMSAKVAIDIVHPLKNIASNQIEHRIYGLATLRQFDLQMVGRKRQYVLALIVSDVDWALKILSRWGTPAQLHGIRLEAATSPEAVAAMIVAYETDQKPDPSDDPSAYYDTASELDPPSPIDMP